MPLTASTAAYVAVFSCLANNFAPENRRHGWLLQLVPGLYCKAMSFQDIVTGGYFTDT